MDIKIARQLASNWDLRQHNDNAIKSRHLGFSQRVHDLSLAILGFAHIFSNIWRKRDYKFLWRAFSLNQSSLKKNISELLIPPFFRKKHESLSLSSAILSSKGIDWPSHTDLVESKTEIVSDLSFLQINTSCTQGFTSKNSSPTAEAPVKEKSHIQIDNPELDNSLKNKRLIKKLRDTSLDWAQASMTLIEKVLAKFDPQPISLSSRERSLHSLTTTLDNLAKEDSSEALSKESSFDLSPEEFQKQFYILCMTEIVKEYSFTKEFLENFESDQLKLKFTSILCAAIHHIAQEASNDEKEKIILCLRIFLNSNKNAIIKNSKENPDVFFATFYEKFISSFNKKKSHLMNKLDEREKRDLESKQKRQIFFEKHKDHYILKISQINFTQSNGICLASCLRWLSTSLSNSKDSVEEVCEKMGGETHFFSSLDEFNQGFYVLSNFFSKKNKVILVHPKWEKKHDLINLETLSDSGLKLSSLEEAESFQTMRCRSARFLLVMSEKQEKDSHATVVERRGDSWMFYDPNFGIFKFDNQDSLENFLIEFTEVVYPKICCFYNYEAVNKKNSK